MCCHVKLRLSIIVNNQPFLGLTINCKREYYLKPIRKNMLSILISQSLRSLMGSKKRLAIVCKFLNKQKCKQSSLLRDTKR